MTFTIENPRFVPGSISGRGMDYTPDGRLVDTRFAVHLDSIDGCLIEYPEPGSPTYALALGGTINSSEDRVRSLFLITPEGAGILVERLASLASMISPEFRQQLVGAITSITMPLMADPGVSVPVPAPALGDTVTMPALSDEDFDNPPQEKQAA